MRKFFFVGSLAMAGAVALLPVRAAAGPITFSTGNPDGRIATASRGAFGGLLETETGDDFVLGQNALITNATFTGLLPLGASLASVQDVEIELYHVFPLNSGPFDGRVPTRVNSPSDNQFAAFDKIAGDITVTETVLNRIFTAVNSVVDGINPSPNQFTGGEGAVTGEEVQFDITFTNPFFVSAMDHDFFRPEVVLSSGSFLWLSAPKPIVAPGTPFTPDLQSWIRNADLVPDWLRIGTDITGQGPFNATFSLSGQTVQPVPEPASLLLLGTGLVAGVRRWRKARRNG